MQLSCHQVQKNTLIKGVIYDYSPTYGVSFNVFLETNHHILTNYISFMS